MAANIVVYLVAGAFLTAAFAAPVSEPNDCVCQTNLTSEEVQELMKFFHESDSMMDEYPVAPGEVSPVVCGNCLEHTRRKRKISLEEEVGMLEDEVKSGDDKVKPVEENEVKPVENDEGTPVENSDVASDELVADNEGNPVEMGDFNESEEPSIFTLKCPKGEKRVSNWCISVDDY